MKSNLFYALFKYRATIDRSPLEDYFTELLGFLFKFDNELAAEWVNHFSNGMASLGADDLRVFTQYSLGKYGRADLLFDWAENGVRKSILIENKIDSAIGERGVDERGEVKTQVTNYLCYQKERGEAGYHKIAVFKVSPLTILPGNYHASPFFLGEFTWGSFYKFLLAFTKNGSRTKRRQVTQFLSVQIMELMKRCDMVLDNFTFQELASLTPYKEFRAKRNKLAEKIIATFKNPPDDVKKALKFSSQVWGEDKVGKHYGVVFHDAKKRDESHIWIHIGFSMLSEDNHWWSQYWPQITLKNQGIPDIQVMLALYPEDENGENAKQSYGIILGRLNAHLPKNVKSDDEFEMIGPQKALCFCFRKPSVSIGVGPRQLIDIVNQS